jgi:hypothetical protein
MALESDETASVGALRLRKWRAGRRRQLRQSCAHCHGVFKPNRVDQLYCGAACKQRAYRRLKAGDGTASARPREAPWLASPVPGVWDTRRPPKPAPKPALRAANGKLIDIRSLIA